MTKLWIMSECLTCEGYGILFCKNCILPCIHDKPCYACQCTGYAALPLEYIMGIPIIDDIAFKTKRECEKYVLTGV